MKMKGKKLIFAFVLALIVCLCLVPCAYAEGEEGGDEGGNTDTILATYDTVSQGNQDNDSEETGNGSDGTEIVKKSVTVAEDATQTNINDALNTGLNSTANGGTFTLVQDKTTANLTYTGTNTIIVDLGGNILNAVSDSTYAFTASSGNVTLTNGTINGRVNAYDNAVLTLDSTLVLNGYLVVWGDGTEGETECKTPTANVNGTILCSNYTAITTNGTDRSGAIININPGASVTSVSSAGIYLPSGKLNITGGTITGTTGIYFKATTLNISGGTIAATGDAKEYVENNNGYISTGDAVVIENSTPVYQAIKDISITGGTFVSANNQAVQTYYRKTTQDRLTGFITGGIFNTDISAFVADGVEVEIFGSNWYVGASIPEPVEVYIVPVDSDEDEDEDEEVSTTVEAVIEGNSTVSIAANEEVVIKLNVTDDSISGESVEIISVIVNGVEVEYTIAEDGSIVLSPEVLAALGPGTHVIYIQTSQGLVKVTITITE